MDKKYFPEEIVFTASSISTGITDTAVSMTKSEWPPKGSENLLKICQHRSFKRSPATLVGIQS